MLYLIYAFVVAFLVSIDQYTKQLVVVYIKEFEKIEIIPDFFYLTHVKNTGAGWSMFEGQTSLFIVITILAVIYFVYELIKSDNKTFLFRLASLLIIGGAIGNFIDRLTSKAVVDFLDFYIFTYDFPVFNAADIFLTIGIFLYIIVILLEMKDAKH